MPEPESVGIGRAALGHATTIRQPAAVPVARRRPADADDPDHHAAAATGLPHALAVACADAVMPIAAIALIRDERGRVLLVRQAGGPFAGAWLLPGGRAAEDESAVHALVREVREETGLTMTDAEYVTGYRTSGDGYDLTVLMYRGPASGTLAPERGSDVRWFDLDAIPDPHPALRRQLFDAGVGQDDDAAIRAALANAAIAMDRYS